MNASRSILPFLIQDPPKQVYSILYNFAYEPNLLFKECLDFFLL